MLTTLVILLTSLSFTSSFNNSVYVNVITSLTHLGSVDIDNEQSLTVIRHEAKNIPKSFDARTKWPHCPSLSEIREQGKCGGCWAFAAASVMTDRICIESQGMVKIRVSEEELLTCCKDCLIDDDGCRAGDPLFAFVYMTNFGIVSGGPFGSKEGCKPYTLMNEDKSPECVRECTNSNFNKSYKKDKFFGRGFSKMNLDIEQIQMEVMLHGPVVTAMDLYEDFVDYVDGVYVHSGDWENPVRHAIKLIGWGEDDELTYWLAANSWGTEWGLGGFFKILRGEDHCRIESGRVSLPLAMKHSKTKTGINENETGKNGSSRLFRFSVLFLIFIAVIGKFLHNF